MKKTFTKDLFVLWLALAALICDRGEMLTMERKNLARDLIVLWICVTALVCAALNMHVSRNMLGSEDS